TAKFDLSLTADESAEGIAIAIEYRTSLFRRATIERYLRCFATLCGEIAARPDAAVETLSILADDDRRLVEVAWNATDVAYPDAIAAHRMFEQVAARQPERRALVDGERALSYAEVDARANRLAHRLVGHGVGRDAVVAILTRPSAELIVAELAALKAGGAFLPLDHRYPDERLEYMLRDSGARVLLAEPGLGGALDWAGPRLALEPALFEGGPVTPPAAPARPSDLAYVIYTSGSTGKPKGVAIEHASLVPFVQRTIDFYGLTPDDRHSKYAGIGFDVSIIETFPPLCCGGELHIVPDAIRLSLDELERWLRDHAITMIDLPTQLAEEFIKQPRDTRLRWMTVGGDRLRRYYPTSFGLANEYGPTEATVSATTFVVDRQYENIPIGAPIANTKVLVLDPAGNLVPPGVPGEICIAGKGLARGYLGAPELTARKFTHDPRVGRLYHTGDLGRWLDDGNLEFLGRIDSQVKIRGFRIELGEIEQAILEVPGVSACVVIDRDDPAGDKFLCGYYVGAGVTVQAIRDRLARRLPDYMVPTAFVRLEAIPFTTSGKVDRRRLPEPELERRERVATPPASMAEQLVLDAFVRALGRADLGVEDDFFDFGGNSIKAVAVVGALAGDFRIGANDLFRLRTARAIARDLPMRRGDLQARLSALALEIRDDTAGDPLAALAPELAAYRQRWRPYQAIDLHQRQSYRDILLTGATGYLGAYLLRDLLVQTDARLHVPVRARARGDGWERLVARTAHHFGPDFLDGYRRRIHVLPGDLSLPQLGLDRGTYDALGRTLDCVIHAAALTKHYGDRSQFVKANVDATRNVIELVRRAGCDLNVISTISVGLGDIPGKPRALFTEFDCDIGQTAGNLYVRTKLEAEKAVQALRDEGLACSIFRVGFLTGDSHTLRFQENASDSGFVQTLASYVALGKIPVTALAQSFCPVNEVSQAILRLLGASALLSETHHIDRTIDPDTARRILLGNPRCEALGDAEFYDWLARNVANPAIGQAATAMLLHEGLLDERIETHTVTLREKTDRLLERAGFAWSEVRPEQVWSLVGN
ncbi:MAG TPA: amino acid adenylation domain-containing protein, partial [Kofleriaceae bacterium]|nr:amino acid adenylation domain-containing protein [Kofleriaceae bacterium]